MYFCSYAVLKCNDVSKTVSLPPKCRLPLLVKFRLLDLESLFPGYYNNGLYPFMVQRGELSVVLDYIVYYTYPHLIFHDFRRNKPSTHLPSILRICITDHLSPLPLLFERLPSYILTQFPIIAFYSGHLCHLLATFPSMEV